MAPQFEMQYAQRLILHALPWRSPKLQAFVEKCLQDKVVLVCIIGDDCARVEDMIDELVVGDGSDPSRFFEHDFARINCRGDGVCRGLVFRRRSDYARAGGPPVTNAPGLFR
jgi:hypothetical protein